MTNSYSRAQREARHAARLDWLRVWPSLLHLPSADEDVTDASREALERAYQAMVTAGLYSRVSERRATRWGIRRCVSELRGRAVHKHQRHGS